MRIPISGGFWKAFRWQNRYHVKTDFPDRHPLDQHLIAEVVENEMGPRVTEGNARLIAAAPDGLLLCNAVLDFWGHDPEVFGDQATVTSIAGKFAHIADIARVMRNKIAGVDENGDPVPIEELPKR